MKVLIAFLKLGFLVFLGLSGKVMHFLHVPYPYTTGLVIWVFGMASIVIWPKQLAVVDSGEFYRELGRKIVHSGFIRRLRW